MAVPLKIGHVVACAVAVILTGCPSRELILQRAEAPWATEGIRRLEVPAFEGPPPGWALADQGRHAVIESLAKGTLTVVERGGQAVLRGALVGFREVSAAGAPRRAIRGATGGLIGDSYIWEMDVIHRVQLGLVVRLLASDGRPLWTKESSGMAEETVATTINWPGSDPMPPPIGLPAPLEPALFLRLRERALTQALEPLVTALTDHYQYRNLAP